MEDKDRALEGAYPSELTDTNPSCSGEVRYVRTEAAPMADRLAVFQVLNGGGRDHGYARIIIPGGMATGEAFFDLLASTLTELAGLERMTICLTPRVITKLKAMFCVNRSSREELESILIAVRTGNARIESVREG